MSNNEEKLLILKMLEQGKITSEEAAKLMDALDNTSKQAQTDYTFKQQKQSGFQDEVSKMRDKMHGWKKDFKKNHNPKDFDRLVEDFSVKAEKLGKNLAVTTVGLVDKVVDFVGSFVDTNSFNFFGNCPIVDKTYEAIGIEGMELDIEGVNNSIIVKKHLDNKILIKSKIRCPLRDNEDVDNILVFNDVGNVISLKPNNNITNISVSHEIYLPAFKFKKIKFTTSNGKIFVEDAISDVFESVTRNGHIELMGVKSEKISVSTKNARINVNYVIGRDIEITTNNSVIDVKHIKAESLSANTMNGRILVENIQNYEGSTEMDLNLKTSNGGIKVNMDDMENRGYKIKAKTTNGGINLLIPEMVYHNINRQGIGGSFVEAESNSFDGFSSKVKINAETINGYIEVVK